MAKSDEAVAICVAPDKADEPAAEAAEGEAAAAPMRAATAGGEGKPDEEKKS